MAENQRLIEVLELPNFKRSSELIKKVLPIFQKFYSLKEIKAFKNDAQLEMPTSFYKNLLINCWIERYKQGEYIIHEGEIGENFYIIVEGNVNFLANNK